MFCTKCGREVPEGAAFCPGCGTAVAQGDPVGGVHGGGVDETAIFVGRNAGYYKAQFRKFDVRGIETFAPTWNWAAFLFNFWWLLYRKLYLWALLWFILSFIPFLGFAFWIVAGLAGNYLYYRHVTSQIRAARAIQPPEQLPAVLSELGGVNGWVVPVGIVVTAGFLLLWILLGIGIGLFHAISCKSVAV